MQVVLLIVGLLFAFWFANGLTLLAWLFPALTYPEVLLLVALTSGAFPFLTVHALLTDNARKMHAWIGEPQKVVWMIVIYVALYGYVSRIHGPHLLQVWDANGGDWKAEKVLIPAFTLLFVMPAYAASLLVLNVCGFYRLVRLAREQIEPESEQAKYTAPLFLPPHDPKAYDFDPKKFQR